MAIGDVRKTLRPGQKGTRRFLRDWGERLVCVRYRFDPTKRVRYTTVELLASEPRPWVPPARPRPDALVYVQIDHNDWKTLRKVREAKGRWDQERGLWRIRYDQAERMRLRSRIVKAKGDLPQAPRYVHRPMVSNRNFGENNGKSS